MNNARFILFVLILIFQPAFTQSYQELQKLQSEYKKILERQSLQKPKDITNAEEMLKVP